MSHPISTTHSKKPLARWVISSVKAVLPALLLLLLIASAVSAAGSASPRVSLTPKCGSNLLCMVTRMSANVGSETIPPQCDMLAICGYIQMHSHDNLVIDPPQCEALGPVCDYIKMHIEAGL